MIRRGLDLVLGAALAAILAVLAAAVIWQVTTRYVLAVPSTTTTEIARLLFLWMATLGGAFTYGQGRHLAFDILPTGLHGARQLIVKLLILLAIAVFAAMVMVWGGSNLVLRTLASGQVTPTLTLPQGWVYLCVPMAGAIILFYAADDLLHLLRGHKETPANPEGQS